MSGHETFSFTRFEYLVHGRRHEEAAAELLRLLTHLHLQSGRLGEIGKMPSNDPSANERDSHFATRLASAVGALFSDPGFHISDFGFRKFITFHRCLAMIFGATPFGSADHVMRLLNRDGAEGSNWSSVTDRDLPKYCLLYSPDSAIALDPDALWERNRRVAAALFIALLSSHIVASRAAKAKREMLLGWLPARLAELSLDDFPSTILHDVWTSCSYADRPDKHAIKRAINKLMRAKLQSVGHEDVACGGPMMRPTPVVMCILEWFHSSHSMYRTYAVSMEALRARYHLVGVSLRGTVDEISRQTFDEVHVVPGDVGVLESVRQVRQLAAELRPDIVYYPSVGMFPETVFLANLRLAPIQMVSVGHPATTHSAAVDCVVVENDFIGDPDCFSERLVGLPPGCMPFRPPAHCPNVVPAIRIRQVPVRIAVTTAPMKIGAEFLAALQRIDAEATVRVEFRFFCAELFGVAKVYLQNAVHRVLPDAVVHPGLPYEQYLEGLDRCDMFVNPFPFGNTNGIVDTVRQGLPGVCLTGREVHSRIDEALFRRIGLPEWLIARSVEEYVRASVRLAENFLERTDLSTRLLRSDPGTVFFGGNPDLFLGAVRWLHGNLGRSDSTREKVLRPPLAPQAMSATAPGE